MGRQNTARGGASTAGASETPGHGKPRTCRIASPPPRAEARGGGDASRRNFIRTSLPGLHSPLRGSLHPVLSPPKGALFNRQRVIRQLKYIIPPIYVGRHHCTLETSFFCIFAIVSGLSDRISLFSFRHLAFQETTYIIFDVCKNYVLHKGKFFQGQRNRGTSECKRQAQ